MKVKYIYGVWDERKYLININDKLELGNKNFIVIGRLKSPLIKILKWWVNELSAERRNLN